MNRRDLLRLTSVALAGAPATTHLFHSGDISDRPLFVVQPKNMTAVSMLDQIKERLFQEIGHMYNVAVIPHDLEFVHVGGLYRHTTCHSDSLNCTRQTETFVCQDKETMQQYLKSLDERQSVAHAKIADVAKAAESLPPWKPYKG